MGPGRSDDVDLVEAGSVEGLCDIDRRSTEHELAPVLVHSIHCVGEDREASRVDGSHALEIDDEVTAALPVVHVGQPIPQFLGRVASSLRRRSHAAMSWARRRTDRVRSRVHID